MRPTKELHRSLQVIGYLPFAMHNFSTLQGVLSCAAARGRSSTSSKGAKSAAWLLHAQLSSSCCYMALKSLYRYSSCLFVETNREPLFIASQYSMHFNTTRSLWGSWHPVAENPAQQSHRKPSYNSNCAKHSYTTCNLMI